MSCDLLPHPIFWSPPPPPSGLTLQQQMQWRTQMFAQHSAAVRAANAKAHAACVAAAKAAAAKAAVVHAAATHAAGVHAAAVSGATPRALTLHNPPQVAHPAGTVNIGVVIVFAALGSVALYLAWKLVSALRDRARRGAPSAPAAAAAHVPPLDPRPARGTWLAREAGVTHHLVRPTVADLARRGIDPATLVPLGNMYLWPGCEQLHTKVLGTTGSGKSTAIRQMLKVIAQRGDRVIIADPDGGYASRFYDPQRGDIILNPFDSRSAGWDLFRDVRAEYDADAIAASLVPTGGGEHAEWTRYAAQFVSACIAAVKSRRGAAATAAELWRLIALAPAAELRVVLGQTPAAAFLERGNEKMFGSIRSTALGACKSLSYLAKSTATTALSLKDYVQDDNRGGGWLFVTYPADQLDALKSLIASELRVLIFATLSRPEGDGKLWFIVDELDALGKINGLTDALARLRKFGGRCVLGFQSIGALDHIYGKEMAAVLLENCNNTLILKSSGKGADGTNAYAASLLGKREVLKTTWNTSSVKGYSSGSSTSGLVGELAGGGGGGTHSGTSWSETKGSNSQYQVEDTILASQIEALANLTGLVKVANSDLWSWCRITPDGLPQVQPPFVVAPEVAALADGPVDPRPAPAAPAAAEC